MVPKGYERVSPLVESVLLPNKTEADELVAVSERSLMTFPSRRMCEGALGEPVPRRFDGIYKEAIALHGPRYDRLRPEPHSHSDRPQTREGDPGKAAK